jgi:hypothetical protein
MKATNDKVWQLMEPRAPLDLRQLQNGVRSDAKELTPYLQQMSFNANTRDCLWPGQSPDGRRRKAYLQGREATPWEGASDARVPAADEAINETKDVMTAAMRAARLEVEGNNCNQDSGAALMLPVVNYVLGTVMRTDVQTQPKLWADMMLEHGHSFMHVGWLTRREIEAREISVDDLLSLALEQREKEQAAAQSGPGDDGDGADAEGPGESAVDEAQQHELAQADEVELWDQLLDPYKRGALIARLMQYDPAMTKAEAGRVAGMLKRGESATYFAPYVRESRAFIEALLLGVDLILTPAAVMDVQKAPRVTRWHWYSEAQLYDMATLEEWDMDMVTKVVANPGPMWDDFSQLGMPAWAASTTQVGGVWQAQAAKEARLFHVAETWHRMPTKAGPSVLFRTVHHGMCPQPLKHEVMKEKHGRIPIVPLQREVKSKLIVASRGIPQVAAAWQNSLKLHLDAQDDSTQLRTTPPVNVPQKRFKAMGDGKNALPIGPWKQLPQASGDRDDISFVELPGGPMDSAKIQLDLRAAMRRYLGLVDAAVPAPVVQAKQQEMAAVFLAGMGNVIEMILMLCQQYMDPIVGAQVAGMAVPLNVTREQIQGQWQMKLSYDVKELDMEFLTKKFQLLSEMLQFDTGGAVPRGELMSYVFSAADPVLAQRLKIDPNGGSDAAQQDETTVIAAMVGGQRITGRLESPQSRLAAHQAWVQNPEVVQMLRVRPTLLQVELQRVLALEFQQEQQTTNATTGRTGEAADAPWQQGGKFSDWLMQTFGVDRKGMPRRAAGQPFAMAEGPAAQGR